MGGSSSTEAQNDDVSSEAREAGSTVHPDDEVEEINGEVSPTEVEVKDGKSEKYKKGEKAEKAGEQEEGEAGEGEAGQAPTRGSGGQTPYTSRNRPTFPVKRFALDDEKRPPRNPPVDAVILDEWSDALFEEARMIAPFNKEEIRGLHGRFKLFDSTNHGYISGEAPRLWTHPRCLTRSSLCLQEFSMQPEFDTNPLRDHIMQALAVQDEDWMDFQK